MIQVRSQGEISALKIARGQWNIGGYGVP